MMMPNFLPSYLTTSPIQMLAQSLESDHMKHIFPITPHVEHIYCIGIVLIFCYVYVLEDITVAYFSFLKLQKGNEV